MTSFHYISIQSACFFSVRNYSSSLYRQTRFYRRESSKFPIDAMTNKNAGTAKPNSRAMSNSVATKKSQVFELFNKVFQNYSPDEVFVSFNGGKDCTVALDLVSQYFKQDDSFRDRRIPVLYIQSKSPFQELEEFIEKCANTYPIELIKRKGSIKQILENVCAERPNLKLVVMGLRRTDPKGVSLSTVQQTDPGWPPLLRVNPILEWTCKDVWTYLRENEVSYCSLYDKGYTSLGDTNNTKQNVHLRREDPATGEVTYRPAYELTDDALERDGRC